MDYNRLILLWADCEMKRSLSRLLALMIKQSTDWTPARAQVGGGPTLGTGWNTQWMEWSTAGSVCGLWILMKLICSDLQRRSTNKGSRPRQGCFSILEFWRGGDWPQRKTHKRAENVWEVTNTNSVFNQHQRCFFFRTGQSVSRCRMMTVMGGKHLIHRVSNFVWHIYIFCDAGQVRTTSASLDDKPRIVATRITRQTVTIWMFMRVVTDRGVVSVVTGPPSNWPTGFLSHHVSCLHRFATKKKQWSLETAGSASAVLIITIDMLSEQHHGKW